MIFYLAEFRGLQNLLMADSTNHRKFNLTDKLHGLDDLHPDPWMLTTTSDP